jgi:hypothetical protein
MPLTKLRRTVRLFVKWLDKASYRVPLTKPRRRRPPAEVQLRSVDDVVWPLRIRYGDQELAFFTTISTFGTPLDITVAELTIELFFPADAATASFFRTVPRAKQDRTIHRAER